MYVASSRIALDPNAPFSVVESVIPCFISISQTSGPTRFEIVYCPYSIDVIAPIPWPLISLPELKVL
jgi:hypothetical protein